MVAYLLALHSKSLPGLANSAAEEVKLTLDKPLPVRLREIWLSGTQNGMSREEFAVMQQRELDQLAGIWTRALQLPGRDDLVGSTLHELGGWRGISDLAIVRGRCENALRCLKLRWERSGREVDARYVERYYEAADEYIEELMWWHTLVDDNSPLAYVVALEVASSAGYKTCLDFGSGVGSGALLFRSHDFDVTLADISGMMLPGGYVYGRFPSEVDPDRPEHIVQDFRPVFNRFAELGFKEVFRDEWLWGHQVFQKSGQI